MRNLEQAEVDECQCYMEPYPLGVTPAGMEPWETQSFGELIFKFINLAKKKCLSLASKQKIRTIKSRAIEH